MLKEGSILVNNENRFLSIPSSWSQESIILSVFENYKYTGVDGIYILSNVGVYLD